MLSDINQVIFFKVITLKKIVNKAKIIDQETENHEVR